MTSVNSSNPKLEPTASSRKAAFDVLMRHSTVLKNDVPLNELIDGIAEAIDAAHRVVVEKFQQEEPVTRKIPEGALIKVEFELRLPVEASEHDIEEWLPCAVLQRGGCATENPLLNHTAEEWGHTFDWEDTEQIGVREESNHWSKPDGSRGCTVHYRRSRRAA